MVYYANRDFPRIEGADTVACAVCQSSTNPERPPPQSFAEWN